MIRSPSIFFVLLFIATAQFTPTCNVDTNQRVDCYPQADATESGCTSRGCCWAPPSSSVNSKMGVPYCWYPSNFGYDLSSFTTTSLGWVANLSQASPNSPYGNDIKTIQAELRIETSSRLRFRLTDPTTKRYEVPLTTPTVSSSPSSTDFAVNYIKSPFALTVTRKSTGRTIFNTSLGGLIFADQFLQITSSLPSTTIMGLGEHVTPLFLDTNWELMTLWARDQGTPHGQGNNLYGVHPFYVNIEPDGNVNGVFLLNSNAMDIILQPTPAITYRTVGGILDFYVFTGPTLDSVVSQFTEVIGRPYMPPYWALGFHLCRWGYNSVQETQKINDQMRAAGVPQDVQWNDIDYMNNHLDFTYDPNAFGTLPQFVDYLHQNGQKYVMITDPGISNQQPANSYPPFDDGISLDIFVKSYKGTNWQGSVWPGPCFFPDFFHPQAENYWTKEVQAFHNQVSFDGLWIDMNEIALTGAYDSCGQDKWTQPPYTPNVADNNLDSDSICMDAVHATTFGNGSEMQYNLHSLYGYSEMIVTMNTLEDVLGKRTIVISRSTYSGSGQYGGHWLGDNNSAWSDLYLSIPGLLAFQLFGIPLVGADICGFNGDTTEELCARWMQLGAFYPFSRNHNTIGAPDQDPVSLGPTVTAVSKAALLTRYSLIPHLYTLFYHAHLSGVPVARALAAEWSSDKNTWTIDQQFLWGSHFLITPVLTQGATSVTGYFPASVWYDYYTGGLLAGTSATTGVSLTLPVTLETLPLHIRGGIVLPQQQPQITTQQSRLLPFYLTVALNQSSGAQGDLFLDDGETLNTYENGAYTYVQFAAAGANPGTLTSTVVKNSWTPPSSASLSYVTVLGVNFTPSRVTVNGASVSTFAYNASLKVLNVTQLNLSFVNAFTISWGQ